MNKSVLGSVEAPDVRPRPRGPRRARPSRAPKIPPPRAPCSTYRRRSSSA